MIWVFGTLAFLFAAPTVTRKSKDPNLFLLFVYGFFLLMAELIGSFSALGDVPNAESLFPNFSQNFSLTGHCGYHWWYDHMAICLALLVTNGLSLIYEYLRWTFAPSDLSTLISKAPSAKKDAPGNFEEMWQRIRDCETISEEEAGQLYADVITLLKGGKVKWQDAESLAKCIHNGRVHTIEMESSGASVVPAVTDTREDSGF